MAEAWFTIAAVSFAVVVALLVGDRLKRRRDEAQAYLKGVRSVLSGDPDAAIEALSDAARLGTPEAIDTYLALGALFRREGDLSRAVRLHRNMLMGRALDPARRSEVERELAEDYRRSGMLAEAAEIYARLAPGDPASAEGLRDVLAESGDLAGAAALQRRLGTPGADPLLAHLLAAQARQTLERDPPRALELARDAVGAFPGSADALVALAECAAAAGDTAASLDAAGRALEVDPRVAPLTWPALGRAPDARAVLAFVEERLARTPDAAPLHFLRGRALHRAGRTPEAFPALRAALERDRSGEVILAMRELLREEQAPAPADLEARHDLLVAALLRRVRPPRCARCGSDAPARTWRCRRCGAFDAFA